MTLQDFLNLIEPMLPLLPLPGIKKIERHDDITPFVSILTDVDNIVLYTEQAERYITGCIVEDCRKRQWDFDLSHYPAQVAIVDGAGNVHHCKGVSFDSIVKAYVKARRGN